MPTPLSTTPTLTNATSVLLGSYTATEGTLLNAGYKAINDGLMDIKTGQMLPGIQYNPGETQILADPSLLPNILQQFRGITSTSQTPNEAAGIPPIVDPNAVPGGQDPNAPQASTVPLPPPPPQASPTPIYDALGNQIQPGQTGVNPQGINPLQPTDINAQYEKRLAEGGGYFDVFKKGTDEHIDLETFKSLGLNINTIQEVKPPARDGKSITDYVTGIDKQDSGLYDNLVNVNGTIYNKTTGKGYATPEELAKDLGITSDKIDWSKILPGSKPTAQAAQTSEQARLEKMRQALGVGPAPVAPDLFTDKDKTKLTTARSERDTLELEMASITADKMALEDDFRKYGVGLVGLPEGGRLGALSEKERELNERLFVLNRREFVAETKLRNRNNVISELMGLQRQEYADAVNQYNTSFNQAIALYGIMDKDEDELKTNAKASLDVLIKGYQGQIEAGTLTVDSLTGIQKAKLQEYETQAGLPVGSTLEILRGLQPGEEKLYSGVDDAGTFTYITRSADGTINTYKEEGATAPKKFAPKGGGSTEPLSILDVQRYQELYPDAGIVAGDTETEANAKAGKVTGAREYTDEELRDIARASGSYEETISGVESDPTILNKDRAKLIAGEIYGINDPGIFEVGGLVDNIHNFLFNR